MDLYDLTQRTFRDVLLVRAAVLRMQSCGLMTLSRLPPGHRNLQQPCSSFFDIQ